MARSKAFQRRRAVERMARVLNSHYASVQRKAVKDWRLQAIRIREAPRRRAAKRVVACRRVTRVLEQMLCTRLRRGFLALRARMMAMRRWEAKRTAAQRLAAVTRARLDAATRRTLENFLANVRARREADRRRYAASDMFGVGARAGGSGAPWRRCNCVLKMRDAEQRR